LVPAEHLPKGSSRKEFLCGTDTEKKNIKRMDIIFRFETLGLGSGGKKLIMARFFFPTNPI